MRNLSSLNNVLFPDRLRSVDPSCVEFPYLQDLNYPREQTRENGQAADRGCQVLWGVYKVSGRFARRVELDGRTCLSEAPLPDHGNELEIVDAQRTLCDLMEYSVSRANTPEFHNRKLCLESCMAAGTWLLSLGPHIQKSRTQDPRCDGGM